MKNKNNKSELTELFLSTFVLVCAISILIGVMIQLDGVGLIPFVLVICTLLISLITQWVFYIWTHSIFSEHRRGD